MPEMVFCFRRWHVGTDDFVYSSIQSVLYYAAGLAVVAVVFAIHKDEFGRCESGNLVRTYYIGMMALLSAHIVLSALLCIASMKGAIIEGHKRSAVPALIYAKATLFFPELAWLFVGTYWAFSGPGDCENYIVLIVKVLVVFGWVMFLSLLVGVLFVFDPLGHKRRPEPLEINRGSVSLFLDSEAAVDANKKLWERRCKFLCCCAAGDQNSKNAFNDIAELFTNFFKGLDLVPTDIAAGLILVQNDQKKSPIKYMSSPLIIQNPPPAQPNNNKRLFKKGKKRHKLEVATQVNGASSSGNHFQHSQSLGAGTSEPLLTNYQKRTSQSSRSLTNIVPDVLVDLNSQPNETENMAQAMKIIINDARKPDSSEGINDERESEGTDEEAATLLDITLGPSTAGASSSDNNNAIADPLPWMSIHNATHYMRYAMGSYGWPLYAYINMPFGCCKLLCKCRCCCGGPTPNVLEDNCCRCHSSAIHLLTGVHDEDIIYASFYNAIYEIPFYVAYDHSRSAVVVSIRGTLSLRDALTDLTAECEDMPLDGVEEPCRVHKGIMRAAKYVYDALKQKGILESAFLATPNYELIITGHSLGAGAATLLSLMLRDDYPTLKVYAFSPPGGLLSLPLARFTRSFVCSVVLGHDLVPRLGIVSMEDLKTKILRCIKDCHKPKYKVFAGGVWQVFCGLNLNDGEEGSTREPLLDRDVRLQMPCYGSQDANSTERELEDAILLSGHSRMSHERLYPPGQIIYIQNDQETPSCCGESTYHATWAQQDVFGEIIVSPRMIMDHMPDTVYGALMQLANRNVKLRQIVHMPESNDLVENGQQ